MNSEIMHNDDYPTQEFEPIIIVKIGGSVISDKKIPYSLRIEILDQLIEQIRILFMQNQKQMILVHGGDLMVIQLRKNIRFNSDDKKLMIKFLVWPKLTMRCMN